MIQQARNPARLSPIPGFRIPGDLLCAHEEGIFEADLIVSHLERCNVGILEGWVIRSDKVYSLNEREGCVFRHARECGHPVYRVANFLDSCLRRNDGLYRN